jgi:hypothetical protein
VHAAPLDAKIGWYDALLRGEEHEATRVHHASRGSGSSLAGRGERRSRLLWSAFSATSRHWERRKITPQGNALFQGFRDNGLLIGRDVLFEPHFTGGDDALFPVFVRELAQKNVRMILANTPAGVRAAHHLDPPVPVLMVHMTDPVREGLIASLARPGGHTTGTASLNTDLTPKLLEFLREIFPKGDGFGRHIQPL